MALDPISLTTRVNTTPSREGEPWSENELDFIKSAAIDHDITITDIAKNVQRSVHSCRMAIRQHGNDGASTSTCTLPNRNGYDVNNTTRCIPPRAVSETPTGNTKQRLRNHNKSKSESPIPRKRTKIVENVQHGFPVVINEINSFQNGIREVSFSSSESTSPPTQSVKLEQLSDRNSTISDVENDTDMDDTQRAAVFLTLLGKKVTYIDKNKKKSDRIKLNPFPLPTLTLPPLKIEDIKNPTYNLSQNGHNSSVLPLYPHVSKTLKENKFSCMELELPKMSGVSQTRPNPDELNRLIELALDTSTIQIPVINAVIKPQPAHFAEGNTTPVSRSHRKFLSPNRSFTTTNSKSLTPIRSTQYSHSHTVSPQRSNSGDIPMRSPPHFRSSFNRYPTFGFNTSSTPNHDSSSGSDGQSATFQSETGINELERKSWIDVNSAIPDVRRRFSDAEIRLFLKNSRYISCIKMLILTTSTPSADQITLVREYLSDVCEVDFNRAFALKLAIQCKYPIVIN